MTLTCNSRHADDTTCQEQDPRHTVHHAHDRTGANCRRWVDPGNDTARIPAVCDWPLLYEVEQLAIQRRGNGSAAKIKARRERLLAAAAENPDDEVLRAKVKRLRHKGARATPAPDRCPIPGCGWDAEGTLGEHLYEHDYNELRLTVARLADENTQLRTEVAKSRRDALFAVSEIAKSVDTETTAQQATQTTIVAKLRIAAMAGDECAKCGHRRGDHQHHGGICKVRRSATTHCACRQYGFVTVIETPKED